MTIMVIFFVAIFGIAVTTIIFSTIANLKNAKKGNKPHSHVNNDYMFKQMNDLHNQAHRDAVRMHESAINNFNHISEQQNISMANQTFMNDSMNASMNTFTGVPF